MDQRLVTALRHVLAKTNELKISDRQKQVVNNEKGIGIYPMDPSDFLELSTTTSDFNVIVLLAKPLEFYNDPKIQKDMNVHPFLQFDETGKVNGHEGRHRAAAVMNAGGNIFQVALYPTPGHRDHVLEDLPTTLTGQFSSFQYDLDYDKMTDWMMGNFKGHRVVV